MKRTDSQKCKRALAAIEGISANFTPKEYLIPAPQSDNSFHEALNNPKVPKKSNIPRRPVTNAKATAVAKAMHPKTAHLLRETGQIPSTNVNNYKFQGFQKQEQQVFPPQQSSLSLSPPSTTEAESLAEIGPKPAVGHGPELDLTVLHSVLLRRILM
jgi:hypothetical protein